MVKSGTQTCGILGRFEGRRPAALRLATALVVSTVANLPALAWNPSGGDGKHARMDIPPGKTYNYKGHAYVVERAIDILDNDGYDNWAALARAHRQDMLDGVKWADHCKGYGKVRVELEVFWGLATKTLYEDPALFVVAGMGHFYNPDTGRGLDMSGWDVAANIGDLLPKFVTWGLTGGLVGVDIELEPSIKSQYPSAAENCQARYDLALKTYRGQAPYEEDRSSLQTAMFYLGWACHFVGDMGQVDHTYDSWIGNHQDYEDFADGKGDDDRYHAKSNGEYHPQWTASQFVVSAATQNHKRQYFDWVENEPLNWNAALKAGLPIAERHTAGLIARFMQQAGVPPKAPPLSGYVYRKGGGRVAGAYIFYRKDGDKGPWDYCQADRDGRYVLPVQPGIKYWIRPAMPDYMFEGWGEFQKESPVSYTQDPGVTSATRRDFYLNPRPNRVAVIAGIDKGPTAGPLAVLRPATRDLAALLIQPRGTSKDDPNYISPTLARDATDAMMDVQSNHYVLGVENGGTGLAEQAYVTVQLRRLIVVATGRIADSPDQIVTAIGQARDLTTKAATRAPISAQTWESVKRNLPRRQVPGPDGKQREVIVLPGIHGADAPVESLLDYGLIPVPSLAGAEIEVRVTPGRGYVGPAAGEPLRLKTDGRGAAQFIVKAGNQAGRLRLALRVTKHPAAARIKPRATIDLLVQPALKGPDPATVQPPTFQPALAMMTIPATIIEPGPTAVRAKPDVYRTHVSIDGSQLRARMLGQVAARPGLGQITEIATPQEPATERPEDWQLIGDARLTTEAGRRALVTNGFAFGALRTEDLTSFTLRFRYRHAEGIADVALRTKIANPPPYLYHVLLANNGVSVSRDEHQQQKELQTVPYTLRPGEWYDFTISVTRETIQVTINGTQVISATDPQPLPAGVLALGSLIGNGFAYSNVVLERR